MANHATPTQTMVTPVITNTMAKRSPGLTVVMLSVSKENTGVPRPVSKQGKSKVWRIKIAGPMCVVGKTTALASPETGFRRGMACDPVFACQSFAVLRHHACSATNEIALAGPGRVTGF